MNEWFYVRDGGRMGPVSDDEMRELVERGEIHERTLCWLRGSDGGWGPFSASPIYVAPVVDTSLPPPIPPSAIDNRYAWVYAFIPLFGWIAENLLYQISPIKHDDYRIYFVYLVVYAVVFICDEEAILRSGRVAEDLPKLWWFLLAPLYLWKRAVLLGQRKTIFWAWCISVASVVAATLAE